MLEFVHKRVPGKCHVGITKLFPFKSGDTLFHAKKLETFIPQYVARHPLYARSLFSLVIVYNRLPQGLVEISDVVLFQKIDSGSEMQMRKWISKLTEELPLSSRVMVHTPLVLDGLDNHSHWWTVKDDTIGLHSLKLKI